MRPFSFELSRAAEWDQWVLEHGLPEVDGLALPVGYSVPISVWRGPSSAAVMHLRRIRDDDEVPDSQSVVESDVAIYLKDAGMWVQACSGGSGGEDFDVLRRRELPPRSLSDIEAETVFSDGKSCVTAVTGLAGVEASTVEVESGDVIARGPIQAPLGWFVATGHGLIFTVRVLDVTGDILTEQTIDVRQQFGTDIL